MCSPPPRSSYLHLLQTPTSQKTPRNPWRRVKAACSHSAGFLTQPRVSGLGRVQPTVGSALQLDGNQGNNLQALSQVNLIKAILHLRFPLPK